MSQGSLRPLPVVGLAVGAAMAAWVQHGSIAAHDWLPLAVLAACLVATVAAAGAAARPARPALVGACALVLLAGWTAASMAWSATPAGARDEALLTGLYALSLLVPLLWLRRARERDRALIGLVAVLAVLAVASAARFALSANPQSALFGGRLDFPITYVNAAAALFALGFWPAAVLASRRGLPVVARGAALGSASLFLALVGATQSKGAVLGLGVSAALVLALAPSRLRLLTPVAVPLALAAAAIGPLTAPYRSGSAAAAHRPGWAALAVLAAGCGIGLVYAAVDRRVLIGPRSSRRVGRLLLAALAAALVAGTLAFFATVQSPRAFAAQRWHDFTHQQTARAGSSHLALLGSNRYDFWRVALDEARRHPLAGIGGRGFYSAYLLNRRSQETPLRAHSLYLDVLAETGVPGLLLLLLGIGAPLVFVGRRLRRPTCVAAFGAATSFFAHAAVDWIWTVPAVGVPALLLLGTGCAGGRRRLVGTKASAGVALAAAAAALLAFAPSWLAYRYVVAAYTSADPAPDLRLARRLDPLSLDPYFAAWRLARTPAEAVAALEGARRLEPDSVAVLYQLGLADLKAGRRAAALGAFRRAAQLDPLEESIRTEVRSVRATLRR